MRTEYPPEFKLYVAHQIVGRVKKCSEICSEYGIASAMVSRWCQEYRERGENAWGQVATKTPPQYNILNRIAKLEQDNINIKTFFKTLN